MYLKSLTLKGFKSFASATTLLLEPGITCIVGPNGSGKSNVVDALAWVMGEQGVKSLRGGKMEDVIFAGTSGRPPLGRAEVQLTIDNTDGALPIDYTEVTISRTMFRSGGSEYAINGQTCRLLDVQELLSDSGIGREMHVIVGQGQLDTILHATPEDRRGFIEEAAGVLKHRKRKEKALRKLDSTQANLDRLGDLISEIRRQLKPLGRQAEVARRAAGVQADVRDARARLLADDLVTARNALEKDLADESLLVSRRAEVEAQLSREREEEQALESGLRESLPALAAAQETWFALSGLRERLRGTQSLAAERVRNAAGQADERVDSGRDPDRLEADAERARAEEQEIAAEVERLRTELDRAVALKGQAEERAQAEDRRVAQLHRAAADRREGLARLTGQVETLAGRVTSAAEEIGRLEASRTEALERARVAEAELDTFEGQVSGLDDDSSDLESRHAEARAALERAEADLTRARDAAHAADRERASLGARREALQMGLSLKDGAAELLGETGAESWSGVLGPVAADLEVQPGYETALAAALGATADAVVVEAGRAGAALGRLRAEELGSAWMLLTDAEHRSRPDIDLPDGARWALDVVRAGERVAGAVSRLLYGTVLVGDLAGAQTLVTDHPELTAVTPEGDLLSAWRARGGTGSGQSLLEAQAAVEAVTQDIEAADLMHDEATAAVADAAERRNMARIALEEISVRRREAESARAAVAGEHGQRRAQVTSARNEAERLERAIALARQAREEAESRLTAAGERLAGAEQVPEETVSEDQREELAQVAREARQQEMDGRLSLRTAEERGRAVSGRAESLARQARQEREQRARASERRDRLLREGRAAQAVAAAVVVVLRRLERSVEQATAERSETEQARATQEEQLLAVRARLRDLDREHDGLVNSVHRDELARAQQRMRIEQLEERALDELGLEPDGLVADYGPHVPIPFAGELPEGEEPPPPTPFDRTVQTKRLRSAERALAELGRVNPLALEEFNAMEERHGFLTEQLEDLKQTRKDLLDIVKEVDDRVEQVFTQAYADVERAFDSTFARLFPGGEGRLVLTDPGDMLTTGIEVEARPPGKKVKRLSLLSGGERSLVAVAFLVALFKARPSPFYILDEVEAALDDTNLGRLLQIYEELRENSQLLVITHQKRTMEVGDALYGVTMRGDGVSTVISQRLRESETA